VNYKIVLLVFIVSFYAHAESRLDTAVRNTQEQTLADRINQVENKIKNNTSHSIQAIAERTQLTEELKNLRQQKARGLLMMAIEGTDVSSMPVEKIDGNSMRLQPKKKVIESSLLNQIADQTIKESNPALMGRDIPAGRGLVLYRDVDPADVYTAKELGSGNKKIIVYKTKDLRGRDVYRTLDGKDSSAIIEGKLFVKEEVMIRDEAGNLVKGYPKAIYSDGTLEIKDQYGFTTRRAQGAYHLTDSVQNVSKNKITTYSGNDVFLFEEESEKKLTAKEKKAVESLRKIFCDL